jgi:hypothetical protein
MRDLNANVTASGPKYTNFPNPVFDVDDDNGDHKLEESEVTADSTGLT